MCVNKLNLSTTVLFWMHDRVNRCGHFAIGLLIDRNIRLLMNLYNHDMLFGLCGILVTFIRQ